MENRKIELLQIKLDEINQELKNVHKEIESNNCMIDDDGKVKYNKKIYYIAHDISEYSHKIDAYCYYDESEGASYIGGADDLNLWHIIFMANKNVIGTLDIYSEFDRKFEDDDVDEQIRSMEDVEEGLLWTCPTEVQFIYSEKYQKLSQEDKREHYRGAFESIIDTIEDYGYYGGSNDDIREFYVDIQHGSLKEFQEHPSRDETVKE